MSRDVLVPTATKIPLVFTSVVSVSLCYVNSAFASATALVDVRATLFTFRIATHSVCFLVCLVAFVLAQITLSQVTLSR